MSPVSLSNRRSRTLATGLLAGLVILAGLSGCSSSTDVPGASTDADGASTLQSEPPPITADPVISEVPDSQWAQMVKTGTWRPGCPVGRADLTRLQINFVNFEGRVKRGELVAHRDTVDDLAEVFSALFDAKFPIERMRPVEKYDGDLRRSLNANNTSAFNCRRPDQINAPAADSPHANGRAVDINPFQNPWKDPRCKCWVPANDFGKPREGNGVITENSLPWELFTERGWIWQNIKVPDYMHFDTGYPSRDRSLDGATP